MLRTPRMSDPFRHVHIDLTGPFALRLVKAQLVKGRAGRTQATLSTERSGQAFICLWWTTSPKPRSSLPSLIKVPTLWLVLSTTACSCAMVCLNG